MAIPSWPSKPSSVPARTLPAISGSASMPASVNRAHDARQRLRRRRYHGLPLDHAAAACYDAGNRCHLGGFGVVVEASPDLADDHMAVEAEESC